MQTRILILIAIVGLAVTWFGSQEMDRTITMIGIFLFLIGFIGAFFSARNKKGMGFVRRL